MYRKKELGKIGENIATKYLIEQNYKIIARNFVCKQGEIDIIASDEAKKEIVFIEVKTRTNSKYGKPSEAVNENKQIHIYRATEYYIYKYNLYNKAIRFDVIEVNLNIEEKNITINQIKNAFIKTSSKYH